MKTANNAALSIMISGQLKIQSSRGNTTQAILTCNGMSGAKRFQATGPVTLECFPEGRVTRITATALKATLNGVPQTSQLQIEKPPGLMMKPGQLLMAFNRVEARVTGSVEPND